MYITIQTDDIQQVPIHSPPTISIYVSPLKRMTYYSYPPTYFLLYQCISRFLNGWHTKGTNPPTSYYGDLNLTTKDIPQVPIHVLPILSMCVLLCKHLRYQSTYNQPYQCVSHHSNRWHTACRRLSIQSFLNECISYHLNGWHTKGTYPLTSKYINMCLTIPTDDILLVLRLSGRLPRLNLLSSSSRRWLAGARCALLPE